MKRVRDYAVAEPSYTVAFAAWELGISVTAINNANAELLAKGIVAQIEPRRGPYAAVYAYVAPTGNGHRLALPELDEHRIAADLAPERGVIVAHTRAEGPSDRPGRNRKRQQKGVRIKS